MKKNTYYHVGPNPTVDLVIFNHLNEVLVIQRGSSSEACPDMWAFPGGFVNTSVPKGGVFVADMETYENAARREGKEETLLDSTELKLIAIGEYEGNGRDPRDNEIAWSKSHAFFAQMDEATFNKVKDHLKGSDDAKDHDWKNVTELLSIDMAFDHKQILIDCIKKFKPELTSLLPQATKLKM